MTELESLLASYLDLARLADPLRFPDGAPVEANHRLGRFDAASGRAQLAALRSIANAIEDLESVEAFDDEVDRTMLLDTIRIDSAVLEAELAGESSNAAKPLLHANSAFWSLMGEDFDAESEAALSDRLAALPGFLESLREDQRPVPPRLLFSAQVENQMIEEGPLEAAAERLDELTIQPARVAVAEHRAWLDEPARDGGIAGWGIAPLEHALARLVSQPLGTKGTLRLLELRRAGVERSLAGAVAELGDGEPLATVATLREVRPALEVSRDYWLDEWQRVGDEMRRLGLPIVDAEPPDPPVASDDGWSMAAFAVRDHAVRMLLAVRAANPRVARRLLLAPGLLAGWGRTVAALLRSTEVFGLPERRAMMSYLALGESAAAEADLLLQARLADVPALMTRTDAILGTVEGYPTQRIVAGALQAPLEALAAALAHEAWQEWYADVGGDPVAFLLQAMAGGGLAVHLARWAQSGTDLAS